jgi:hypothetical protein
MDIALDDTHVYYLAVDHENRKRVQMAVVWRFAKASGDAASAERVASLVNATSIALAGKVLYCNCGSGLQELELSGDRRQRDLVSGGGSFTNLAVSPDAVYAIDTRKRRPVVMIARAASSRPRQIHPGPATGLVVIGKRVLVSERERISEIPAAKISVTSPQMSFSTP